VSEEHGIRPEQASVEDPSHQHLVADLTWGAVKRDTRPILCVSWLRHDGDVRCAFNIEATPKSEVGTNQRMELVKSD